MFLAFLIYAGISTVALWLLNGGVSDLAKGNAGVLMSIGRLTGLLAALAAMTGLYLAARPRGLERRFGLERMLAWHRVAGIVTVSLVVVHAVADTVGWARTAGVNVGEQLMEFVAHQDWMTAALVGALLFLVVGVTSWRRIRRLMPYESWYFIHLSGYLAVLLAFGHQVTIGSDVTANQLITWWWATVFICFAVAIGWARIGDLGRAVGRGSLRVSRRIDTTADTTSIIVSGPGLKRLEARPGHYFMIRLLTSHLWWQAHPISLSAAPEPEGLRFTVKDLGDGSAAIGEAPVGTRVILEGPYGIFTVDAARGAPVLLVAGGIGVAPIRALLEDCSPGQRPVVVIRARRREDIAHLDEIALLAEECGGAVHLLTGPRQAFREGRPFHPEDLHRMVPDLTDRDVFVCGPGSLERAVVDSVRALGVQASRIHREGFRC